MKILFTLVLFLICTLSYGQKTQKKNGGYFSIAIGANFQTKPDQDPVIGLHLSGNGELGKGAYLGLEAGVVKFQLMEGVYVPIQLKFTMMPAKNPKKVSPLVILAPGYGAYNHTTFGVNTTGGFVFFGGIGAAFPGKSGGRAFITAGYSLFGFSVNNVDANVETIGVRVGVMLH